MSRSDTLQDITNALISGKVTERQRGRDALRLFFQKPHVVLHFDPKGNGKAWLSLFQALFESYAKELKACTSKTGALPTETTGRGSTSLRRLGDVASVLRWLTEQSVERLNARVLKSLLAHLTKALAYRGRLLPPVALDYAKTIHIIIKYRPHLHALEDEMWHTLLALAFNVVLGHAPKRKLTEDVNTDDEDAEEDSDVEMEDARSYADSDRASEVGASPSKLKRTRQDSHPPRPSPHRGPSTLSRTTQSVTLEQIEFMSILSALLQSPNAPILASPDEDLGDEELDPHRFPRVLLHYFSQFLRVYSGDTSLHHDFLIALSSALSPLAINCRQVVSAFAHENWHSLVNMWGTKNQSLKEHLVVVVRQLLPLITAQALPGEEDVDPIPAVAALWNALEGVAQSRGGTTSLSVDSLQLCVSQHSRLGRPRPAFVADTFQHGWHFNNEQALSWAVLELQADCAEMVRIVYHQNARLLSIQSAIPAYRIDVSNHHTCRQTTQTRESCFNPPTLP